MIRSSLLASLLLIGSFATSLSVKAQVTMVEYRLGDVCSLLTNAPISYEKIFTASFLKQVPPFQLAAGVQQMMLTTGSCIRVNVTERISATNIKADVITDKGYRIPVTMSIESQAPYLINGLFLGAPQKLSSSMEEVISDLKGWEGATSLCVVDLEKDSVLAAHNADAFMPIGSTFKLYVLGELARSVAAGEHAWYEVVSLNKQHRSLPSGVMQDWPEGSPVTLHTLATQMISISDNTATDHLIHALGREKVEAVQGPMGHREPSRNAPFLTTREMFALKFSNNGSTAVKYAATKDEEERRKIVKDLSAVMLDEVTFADTVSFVEDIEWFATTRDLCKAMNWLRGQAESAKGQPAQDILGVNKGVDLNESAWKVVGYKGGSETGVLNMTYLLQRKDGRWFALSVSWMNTKEDVDLTTFAGLVSTAIGVLEKQ